MATAPAEGASDPTLIEVTIEVVRFPASIQGLTIRADHSQQEHGNEDEMQTLLSTQMSKFYGVVTTFRLSPTDIT